MALNSVLVWRLGMAVALIAYGSLSTPAQSLSHRLLKHKSERRESFHYDGGVFLPVWNGGGLLVVEKNQSDEPTILRIDREGQQERIGFSFPGGRYFLLFDVAAGQDGTIAAVGSAYSKLGQPGFFLAKILPDRSRQLLVQLQGYLASVVTILPDGGMWTIGSLERPENPGVYEYNVLKRFDISGRQLGTARVNGRGILARGQDAATNSVLRSTKDRVGWLTNGSEYIEFAVDGHELGRYPPPPGPSPSVFDVTMALSSDNEVLVGARDNRDLKLWSLAREGRLWTAVELSGAKLTHWATLGFDAAEVVVADDSEASGITLSRFAYSAAQ
jgi:hypothetical protein